MSTPLIHSLRDGAIKAIAASDLSVKMQLAQEVAQKWFVRKLSLRSPLDQTIADRPGRPAKPDLVPPIKVERRPISKQEGRIALMHAIAHIELNATDLALDIVARFASEKMPLSFFDNWMQVAFDEAKHFKLISGRLQDMGAQYGDLTAHDGLWEAAHDTRNDLIARLAVVPLVLEARGLDVTPPLQAKMRQTGDHESAQILDIIYEDEKTHVAVGAKWFRFLCARHKRDPAKSFQKLVRENFHGSLKAPFNELARAEAGMTTSFYRALSPQNRS